MSDDKFSKDKTVERHSNLNARTKKIATYEILENLILTFKKILLFWIFNHVFSDYFWGIVIHYYYYLIFNISSFVRVPLD